MSQTHDETFAAAARALLDRPSMDREDRAWADVVTRRNDLAEFFEHVCGWRLHVDARAGIARLHKRVTPDPSRGLRRAEASSTFTREGYALLMLAAADLVTRPTTTISELAANLQAATAADPELPPFDPTVFRHRRQLVDAIEWFDDGHFVRVTAGALSAYQDSQGDAVIVADLTRFAQLLSSVTPPSRIARSDDWIKALSDEPRYQSVIDGRADADAEARHARHLLCRGLLDGPALIVDDLDEHVVRYLTHPSGRRAVRDAVERVGFIYEENSDCVLAVDETTDATDATFGRTTEIATQVAVAVLDQLSPNRDCTTTPLAEVEAFVDGLLQEDPGWATTYQRLGGAATLTQGALDTLESFMIATVDNEASTVSVTPVGCRYALTVTDNRGQAQSTETEDTAP